MKASSIASSISTLTALALATGCVDDEGTVGHDPESADDVGDVDFRSYEGVIANPHFGLPVITGTTVGKIHEFSPTCGYSNGAPDVSYTWTAPATASYTFSTRGSSFDTILHIRPFANSAVTLGCNDNTNDSKQSSVDLNLNVGTTVIIVVDGYSSQSGAFALNITKGKPCPGGCDWPPSQCHAYFGECVADDVQGTTSCWYPASPAGTPCNDGNACSVTDVCMGYSCVASVTRTCNTPPSDCYQPVGTCDWSLEDCVYTPHAAGTDCDDGDPCTESTYCNGAGSCVPEIDNCACDPATENCSPAGGCPTAEMQVDPSAFDPRGFAATPEPEGPAFDSLDEEAFVNLERELREQAR